MKGLLTLLVLAGLGFFGYNYYVDHKAEIDEKLNALLKREQPAQVASAPEPAPAQPAPAAVPDAPAFESKVDAAGEKFAPPGVFYVVDRVSAMTNNGVKAVSPGEKVKLLQRLGNGRMKVTTGDADFEVKESQVTNDLDLAREAEKREFVARGGKL